MSEPKDKGRILLWRKIEDSWQWEKPLWRSAWVWMLVKATHKAYNGLQVGQVRFTLSMAKREWGMTKDQARHFIGKCVQEGDIMWEPGRPGKLLTRPTSFTSSFPTSDPTSPGKITLLNYTKYRAVKKTDPTSDPTSRTTSNPASYKECITSNDIQVLPAPDGAVASPNSQVYDFFVESKRKAHDRPEWLPTANQAKILRANIKTLLEQFSADELVEWLRNFFQDPWVIKAGWPWKPFMADPIRWKQGELDPAVVFDGWEKELEKDDPYAI